MFDGYRIHTGEQTAIKTEGMTYIGRQRETEDLKIGDM